MNLFKFGLIVHVAVFILSACTPQIQAVDTPEENQVVDTDVPVTEPSQTSEPTLPATDAATETAAPTALPLPEPSQGSVRGIILFIGDGMGPNQRLGGQWAALGQEGVLVMDTLPVRGQVKTKAARSPLTDSAAAATAMATGVKTDNGNIGIDVNENPLPTILEQAQDLGWAVGLVTTVQVTHATPAAFAAHVTDRNNYTQIAIQIMDHQVDVLLGGGEDDFLSSSERGCYAGNGLQPDGASLVDQAVSSGYVYVCTRDAFLSIDVLATKKLLGLFGGDGMAAPFQPSLAEMTKTAIEILSQDPEGFFLMVEAGQIDWAGHDNEAEDILQFTVGFDTAITEGLLYAVGEPNSLLIVTADHETGGMSLNLDGSGSFREDGPFTMPDGTEFWVDWEVGGHTPIDVPLTAQGPWSELLWGEYQNTWIYKVMYFALTGFGP